LRLGDALRVAERKEVLEEDDGGGDDDDGGGAEGVRRLKEN